MRMLCTLTDVRYVPQVLAMYGSLQAVGDRFVLGVLCMDAMARTLLERLDLEDAVIIDVAELERYDTDAAAARPTRSHGEYCWTLSSCLPRYLLRERWPEADEVTYLDADQFFFSSLEPVFEQSASVLLMPHRYARSRRHQEIYGYFNVSVIVVRRDAVGLAFLDWWRGLCVQWCYGRLEDGKFADQKYLDRAPREFDSVEEIEHVGAGLAPWNVANHRVTSADGRVVVDGRPLINYHFHALQYRSPPQRSLLATGYRIPRAVQELVYRPYLGALGRAIDDCDAVMPGTRLATTTAIPMGTRLTHVRNRAASGVFRYAPGVWRRIRS